VLSLNADRNGSHEHIFPKHTLADTNTNTYRIPYPNIYGIPHTNAYRNSYAN